MVRDEVNGIFVEPGSTDELENKLTLLLGDTELKNKLGMNARKTIEENHSIEKIAEDHIKLYTGAEG